MAMPDILRFEDLGRPGERVIGGAICYYRKDGRRAPRKGEWFISGAIPMAYKAKTDQMTTNYEIAVPTHYASPARGYVPGDPVVL